MSNLTLGADVKSRVDMACVGAPLQDFSRPLVRFCVPMTRVYHVTVPGSSAVIGDVYWVYREATSYPVRVGKAARPMGCVAEQPRDPAAWTGLPRLSSGIGPGDAPSRAMPEVSANRLEREGAWSVRGIHSVKKQDTGKEGLCQAPGFVEGVSSGCGGCLLGGVGSGLFRRGWGVSVLVFFWGVHVDRGMRGQVLWSGVIVLCPSGWVMR